MEAQDSVSSPASEASICSDSDSCSSICTYLIDGSEVVCIPDIHKIVIHLYGQSVQVGYYLQRLQIPTQRFSTVHVKRLKALHALNSKATLCTYILKSDALRLLKMYDVFCTVSKLQQIQWNGPLCLEGIQSAIPPRDEVMTFAENLTTAQEPVEVVKISTFLIDGEVVVSVPDAHKVVQVLNGQSVQVRYNMDKLGIVKRRYSYSQVYQLRAISDLKRPSMCTFITKHDADILLGHYLTNENSSRMKYIQWLPPVRLEELPTCGEDSQDGGYTGVPSVDARNVVRLDGSDDQHFGQECVQRRDLCEQTNATETRVTEHGEATNSSITQDSREKNSSGKTSENESADAVRNPLEVQQDCGRRELESNLVTSASYSQVPCAVSMEAARGCTEAVDSPAERMQHDVGQNEVGRKRTYDEFKDKESVFLELKRLRDENHEIGATLERKETEMRILHDSYLYQIRKEREKREELENDLIDLRGSVAFASGVAIRDPNIKQENV
ncbi:hypothetical protein QZH41_000476 [Actinostola sp. cb2023]|nr:hypothetical protein QZH41_000476 [Actinostola sp. cb2023]